MTKRKYNDNAPSQRKKIKLDGQGTLDCQIFDGHSLNKPPLSLATPKRLEKRKKTQDSQTEPFDEPEIKRARRSPSDLGKCSRDTSPEEWAIIGYEPDQGAEEPSGIWQNVSIASRRAMLFIEEMHNLLDSQLSTDRQNPLPSPAPSDGDADGSNAMESMTVDPIQAQYSTSKPPRQRFRKRNAIPSRAERRQPHRKGKDNQNQPQDRGFSPAVQEIICSKRSSRRDPGCKLWHLGDDGTACSLPSIR
ncbi:hypothetical protein V8C37DRAFT_198814 [Trichoderma ceciliae]